MSSHARNHHARRVLLGAALATLCPLAHAAVTSCTVTTTGVAFGTYTPLTPTALTGTGTIAITCTVTSHKNTITIDLGTGLSNSYTLRTLVSGTNTLNYNLYLDPALTQIWGNGTGSSVIDTVTLTRKGGATQVSTTATVYGAVAASQDPAPGTYGDTILVTVNY
jgi:spore coat protein U-like protein